MKHVRTEFIPYASISFTDHELEVMIYCASHHYDLNCNNLVHPKGALFNMKKLKDACGTTDVYRLGYSDLDSINKALEIGSLIVGAKASMKEMVDTSVRLRKDFYQLLNDLRKITPNLINHE